MVAQAKGTSRDVGLGSRILGPNAPVRCPLDKKLTQIPRTTVNRKKKDKMPKWARRARNGHGAHQSGRGAHEMARRVAFRRASLQERVDRVRRDCYRVAGTLPRSFAGQSVSLRKRLRLRRQVRLRLQLRLRRQVRLRFWHSLSLPRLGARQAHGAGF